MNNNEDQMVKYCVDHRWKSKQGLKLLKIIIPSFVFLLKHYSMMFDTKKIDEEKDNLLWDSVMRFWTLGFFHLKGPDSWAKPFHICLCIC
jgi:hypothetical protein